MPRFKSKDFPLNIAELVKGTVLTIDQLEQLVGWQRDHANYSLGVQKLRDWIEWMAARAGRPVVARMERGSLAVLVDAKATHYCDDQYETAIRKGRRYHRKMQEVDAGNLTPDQLVRHDRRLTQIGAEMSAISLTRRGHRRRVVVSSGVPVREDRTAAAR